MSTDKGGPAFPTLDEHGFNSGAPGMTLHDYFMAHAPVEPQRWFRPVVRQAPVRPASVSMLTEAERNELAGLGDWMSAEDCQQPRIKAYALLRRQYHKDKDEWDRLYLRESYTQWPAAWADRMIEERNKS